MIKWLFIILVIIFCVWNLSGCVDNIVLSRMFVWLFFVVGKFDCENVWKFMLEVDIKSFEEIRWSVCVR